MAVGESGNRLMICPICGKVLKDVYVFGNLPDYVVYNKDEWCENCDKEIIPLATPQEIDRDYYSFTNTTDTSFAIISEDE